MLVKKYKSIMREPEAYRNKWAAGLTIVVSVFIFVSFAFYKGFISFGDGGAFAKKDSAAQVANVVSADKAPSPIESTGETFKAAFGEIGKQFQQFKDSMSAVLVPFVTGIDVYERK
jgi:hypothetical protein